MAEPVNETSGVQEASEQRIFAQASSVGDSASAVDSLGFELYVNAVADFLGAPNTRAPLTCSIEGSWGSGKSSFMLQLRNRLRAVAPASRTIEFNAWKYDKQEELWAAFALKVTRCLRENLSWAHRIQCDFRLFWIRIRGWSERLALLALVLAWLLLLTGFGGVIVWTTRASHDQRIGLVKSITGTKDQPSEAKDVNGTTPAKTVQALPEPWYEWLSWSPLATSVVLIVLLTGKIPESLRKRLFEAQLERYIDKPDYKGKAAFVDTFSEDFSKMMEAYAPVGGGKTFVFIDDLDRCEAPKAADLMQAINLMIGDGNSLIFILGLDRAKVAAAIAFKFRDIVPYLDPSSDPAIHPNSLRSFGDAFLEKFIQLSFRLPISSNDTQARKFIDSLVSGASRHPPQLTEPPTKEEAANAAAESTRRALRIESGAESQRIREVVMMVREVLEYSPRRIKNFLSSFRLALYIASAQGLLDEDSKTGEAEVTPERLGKFLVLTSRYPALRPILDTNPAFLYEIERLSHDIREKSQWSELHWEWIQLPGVQKLMRFGIVDKTMTVAWSKQYSMKNFPGWKFATILPSIPTPAKVGVDAVETPRLEPAQAPAEFPRSGTTSVDHVLNIDSTQDLSPYITEFNHTPSPSSSSGRSPGDAARVTSEFRSPQGEYDFEEPNDEEIGSSSNSGPGSQLL
ncbi:MAG: P-loop NTPase fold protein [Terracidiphilus sp.]|jgi:hypothetical protein